MNQFKKYLKFSYLDGELVALKSVVTNQDQIITVVIEDQKGFRYLEFTQVVYRRIIWESDTLTKINT